MKQRKYGMDNIRGLLIILVVFGHMLEIAPNLVYGQYIYKLIYSFHMPAFIFIFGYFAKFSKKRIISTFAFPYLLFQTIYILVSNYIWNTPASFSYTTPWYHLWFLVTCIYYQIFLLFIDFDSQSAQLITLSISIIISLLVGFDPSIGEFLSLSRTIVFFPWFLLGYYYRKNESIINKLMKRYKNVGIIWGTAALLLVLLSLTEVQFPTHLLHSMSPGTIYSPSLRIYFFAIACIWIFVLLAVGNSLLNRNIPILTSIGQNSFSLFILHAFAIFSIKQISPPQNTFGKFCCSQPLSYLLLATH